MDNNNQRIQLTKKLLKNSLISLLSIKSIDHISIKSICENAGINRSTFYKHYGSQYDLLNEMVNDAILVIQTCCTEISNTESNNVNATINNVIEYLYKNSETAKLIFLKSQNDEFMAYVKPLISQDVIPVLEMQGIPNNQVEYILDFLIGGTSQIIKKWVETNMHESPNDITKLILSLSMGVIISTNPTPTNSSPALQS